MEVSKQMRNGGSPVRNNAKEVNSTSNGEKEALKLNDSETELTSSNDNGDGANIAHDEVRLTFELFGTHKVSKGDNLEIHYLTTILSLQRQFRACEYLDENYFSIGEQSGEQTPLSILKEKMAQSDDCAAELLEEPIVSKIAIPTLNESQQRACDAFLMDRERRVHIVQGCV